MNKKASVLILAVADFPYGYATTQRILLIAKIIQEANLTPVVGLIHSLESSIDKSDLDIRGVHEGIQYVYLSGRVIRPKGIVGKVLDTLSGIFAGGSLLLRSDSRWKFSNVILYTPNVIKCLPAIAAASLRKVPVFLEACEVRSMEGSGSRTTWRRRVVLLGDILTEKFAYKFARGVLVISSGIRNFYFENGFDKKDIFFLPALIDCKAFDKNERKEVRILRGRKYLLCSGTYAPKEGVEILIEAFGKIAQKHKDAHMVFTGKPSREIKEKILHVASAYSVQDRLVFVGFLNRDELMWCYENAAGLLCCRTKSPFASYGFPTKLVEYLAAGRPVIATDVGDIGMYIRDGDTGYLAEAENPDSIAGKMTYVLSGKNGVEKSAVSGKVLAREMFDYRVYAEPLREFLDLRAS